ncbi:MAG: subclass B1 metallo-beta-lactamase [Bacteroidales bacterium]|nr:subclass B1 metallo-beta-lactamase [Bacteroidales bacterium]
MRVNKQFCIFVLVFLSWAHVDGFRLMAGDSIDRVDKNIAVTKLTDKAWWLQSSYEGNGILDCNHLLILDNTELILVNTPATDSLTAIMLNCIEKKFNRRVTKLIVSHFHDDSSGGLKEAEKRGIISYSGNKTKELLKTDLIDITFSDSLNIATQNTRICLYFMGAGHSSDGIVVWCPDENILFGGCLMKSLDSNSIGNLSDADVKAWPGTMRKAKDKFRDVGIVIPGHGAIGDASIFDHTIQIIKAQPGFSQVFDDLFQKSNFSKDSIGYLQIKTDTLFNSNQTISLLRIPNTAFDDFCVELAYSMPELLTTSEFGKKKKAVAAINGGYYDRDNGGSVTYFELNDSVIHKTRTTDRKWAKPDSLINGAIVILKDSSLKIQPVKPDLFYEHSKQELSVLVTGPMLLLNAALTELPDIDMVVARNPRTCLCRTAESLYFVVVDGRRKEAAGMSLAELQTYLQRGGCIDAINLDGGGSSTLWVKEKGVVNLLSDPSERPVANAVLILKR